ncbi:hypothetical protein FNF28_04708 [Cafeteria roenbergensis]|uniref:Uncharacterized protein n=1 Tax=Cafeteria roenbergensis TaxID=33653 RepID=A0A5A8DET0_CAFRO|nr:hypothetical protein FNF28_04708 [Cafeteria roenbergensis]
MSGLTLVVEAGRQLRGAEPGIPGRCGPLPAPAVAFSVLPFEYDIPAPGSSHMYYPTDMAQEPVLGFNAGALSPPDAKIVTGEDLRLLAREGTLPNIADLQLNNDGTRLNDDEPPSESARNRGSAPLAACVADPPTSFDGVSVVFLQREGNGTTTIAVGVKLLSRPRTPVTVSLTSDIRVCRAADGRPGSSDFRLCARDDDCDGLTDASGKAVAGVCLSAVADVLDVTPSTAVVSPGNWSMSITELTQPVDKRPASPSDFLYVPDAVVLRHGEVGRHRLGRAMASAAHVVHAALGAVVLRADDPHYSAAVVASRPGRFPSR